MGGLSAGDALGAGYEFGPSFGSDVPVAMIGGGLGDFAPGEWTDDTSMAVVIAQALVLSGGKVTPAACDRMVQEWEHWAQTAPDVGNQTRAVLNLGRQLADQAGRQTITAEDAVEAAALIHQRTGRSGGNGSLMRTAPVAIAFLGADAEEAYGAAVRISELTHFDAEAGEACGLWTVAIHHALRTGELNIRYGLNLLDSSRSEIWNHRIDQAETSATAQFANNGWVVEAFQSAWCAISTTSSANPGEHLVDALEAAVRGGQDTDTVAAIAGSLIGAAYGQSAIPSQWQSIIHGWPGLRAADLDKLAITLATPSLPVQE